MPPTNVIAVGKFIAIGPASLRIYSQCDQVAASRCCPGKHSTIHTTTTLLLLSAVCSLLFPITAKKSSPTCVKRQQRTPPLVGLCTGSFVLAEAGQLDGVRCAVHVDHVAAFADRYPRAIPLPNAIYAFDQDRITCPGGTAAIDVAVEILSQRCGVSRGTKGLSAMVVDQHRKAHHAGRMSFQELEHCGDWRVEQAVLLMRQTLSEPISIDQIARKLSISRRQLNRVFKAKSGKSPQELWRDMRLEHARWRLVNTSKNVTQIAHECGFSDCAHFVRWFKRKHDCGPSAFRLERQSLDKNV